METMIAATFVNLSEKKTTLLLLHQVISGICLNPEFVNKLSFHLGLGNMAQSFLDGVVNP